MYNVSNQHAPIPLENSTAARLLNLLNPSPPNFHIRSNQPSDPNSIYTEKRALTPSDLEEHLQGKIAVGLTMFVSELEVIRGEIDIDDFDGVNHRDGKPLPGHAKLIGKLEQLGLPFILSVSKSGGFRLSLFLKKPTAAAVVRRYLKSCLPLLGLPETTEVFPKQNQLGKGHGNSTIAPFANGQIAHSSQGELDVEGYIACAEDNRVEIVDAPPCIQHGLISGFDVGCRDIGIHNLAVYLHQQGQLDRFVDLAPRCLKKPFEKPYDYEKKREQIEEKQYEGFTGCGDCQFKATCSAKVSKPGKETVLTKAIGFLRRNYTIQFDEHFGSITVDGQLLDDAISANFQKCFAETFGQDISRDKIDTATRLVAHEKITNWWNDWLDALPTWDGVDRFEIIAKDISGVPAPIYPVYLKKTLIASIVRAFYKEGIESPPLIKQMLVLAGAQDSGKSSLVYNLLPVPPAGCRIFTDSVSVSQLSQKPADFWASLLGIVFGELAEMVGNKKDNVDALKNIISSTSPRVRLPYGRYHVNVRISAVLIGTINPGSLGFLKDPTGSTRFFVIPCRKVEIGETFDLDYIRDNREQIWAQALHAYYQGEKHWLDTPKLKKMQYDHNKEFYYLTPRAEDLIESIERLKQFDHISNYRIGEEIPGILPHEIESAMRYAGWMKVNMKSFKARIPNEKGEIEFKSIPAGWISPELAAAGNKSDIVRRYYEMLYDKETIGY
ncbi:VapE domain-containing protein [Desulfofustis glycolicus]|uniref:Virulence-associated protein E n=1 Tax=Desulfofustis glycolicus DSM 9705 TaxID=1121409 RepID=A0A1M5YDD7_9BACT|nr:VapE domain-containing protein [Desulfofustis glycolicus]SHI09919.1 Virulence-associated protein E [Desulfofustis glycolicus DSM 9705]